MLNVYVLNIPFSNVAEPSSNINVESWKRFPFLLTKSGIKFWFDWRFLIHTALDVSAVKIALTICLFCGALDYLPSHPVKLLLWFQSRSTHSASLSIVYGRSTSHS